MVDPVGLFIVNPLSVSPRNRVRTETRAAFAERLPPIETAVRRFRDVDKTLRKPGPELRVRFLSPAHVLDLQVPPLKWHSEGLMIR